MKCISTYIVLGLLLVLSIPVFFKWGDEDQYWTKMSAVITLLSFVWWLPFCFLLVLYLKTLHQERAFNRSIIQSSRSEFFNSVTQPREVSSQDDFDSSDSDTCPNICGGDGSSTNRYYDEKNRSQDEKNNLDLLNHFRNKFPQSNRATRNKI